MLRLPAAALALALISVSARASADLRVAGEKRIKATFEVKGIAEHPGWLFVVFPYLDCELDPEFLEMNPQRDDAWTNYQVLRPDERYEEPKFCWGRIYAFDAKGFTTQIRTLDEDQGFYRKKGDQLVIINEFERLKNSEKVRFVAEDSRVRASETLIDFPIGVHERRTFVATHDVLGIVSVDDKRLVVEGLQVVLHSKDEPDRTVPYVNGKRPEEAGANDSEELYRDQTTPEQKRYFEDQIELYAPHSGMGAKRRRRNALVGGGALALTGVGLWAFLRRRRARRA